MAEFKISRGFAPSRLRCSSEASVVVSDCFPPSPSPSASSSDGGLSAIAGTGGTFGTDGGAWPGVGTGVGTGTGTTVGGAAATDILSTYMHRFIMVSLLNQNHP